MFYVPTIIMFQRLVNKDGSEIGVAQADKQMEISLSEREKI